MKIKEVTLKKEFKVGLPNYSNITASAFVTWEIAENEEFNWNRAWDIINQQLTIQSNNIDQSWIQLREYKDKYKVILNTPKTKKGGEK